MPSTVDSLFAAGGVVPEEVVRWGQAPRLAAPGVYLVSLSEKTGETSGALPECPISKAAVRTWLQARPELRLDGARPDAGTLATRLGRFWLPDETVLYIGLAGTSVRGRVKQYYATPLGARRPHAGGPFLKALSNLDELWVHCAAADNPAATEDAMLQTFVAGVSNASRANLHDSTLPIPFANLEWPRGRRKLHGILGSKGEMPAGATGSSQSPQSPRTRADRPLPPESVGTELRDLSLSVDSARSQRVTATDLGAGRIRFPRAAKGYFPEERSNVEVVLRGRRLAGRYDPRRGPDRERSAVLTLGKAPLQKLVSADEALAVSLGPDRVIRLD